MKGAAIRNAIVQRNLKDDDWKYRNCGKQDVKHNFKSSSILQMSMFICTRLYLRPGTSLRMNKQ